MKSVRVLFVVLGLSALPLFGAAAQGNGNGNQCKTAPSSPNGRGVGIPTAPGLVKKCPVTPAAPPPNQQPAASFTFNCSDRADSESAAGGKLHVHLLRPQLQLREHEHRPRWDDQRV